MQIFNESTACCIDVISGTSTQSLPSLTNSAALGVTPMSQSKDIGIPHTSWNSIIFCI